MLVLAAVWALSSLIYLGFVGQLSVHEAALALACGLAAAAWAAALVRVAVLHFRFEAASFGALVRALANLPSAVAKVAAVLIRGRGGKVVQQHFIRGRDLAAADVARRATALLAVSLAPDKFALRIPVGRDQIELHSLVAASTEADPRWPA